MRRSPEDVPLSEWPMRMYRAPVSFTMAGDTAGERTSFSKYMFCTPVQLPGRAQLSRARGPRAETPPLPAPDVSQPRMIPCELSAPARVVYIFQLPAKISPRFIVFSR